MVVVGLLLVCCAKGIWATVGVEVPPDPDTVRDVGFIQGFLDGNWLGDPSTIGAWRWYPPLLHGVAAIFIRGLGLPPLSTWLHAGAFLNLLSPLSFYLMNRRLFGPWPAAAATAMFVLFYGVVMPSDATAGYTPWTLTPALTLPLFFASVWLIADRIPRLRMIDAALLGSVFGLVFLAHTVPAVLLSGIAVCTALGLHGWQRRTLVWLAAVATVELIAAAPFLLPLVVAYHLHIANPGPGNWAHPALTDPATLLPNALGLLTLGWLLVRREWSRLPLATTLILGAWIGLCVAFLGRHYVCAVAGQTGGACGVFVVPAHHYHAYLQAAWASVTGLAVVRLWEAGRRCDMVPLLILAVSAGLIGFFAKPEDAELRRLGSTRTELIMDRAAYDWILTGTGPDDLFVTELPDEAADMGPGAATVIAAGRKLVAPPASHSNPYVAWAPRNARRISYLRAGADLCLLLRKGRDAFFLLPNGRGVEGATRVFSSAFNTIFRVDRGACPAADVVERNAETERPGETKQ